MVQVKLFIVLIVLGILFGKPVYAAEIAGRSGVIVTSDHITDTRVDRLEGYLKSRKSPLAPYAKNFVEEADKYKIDWRLVAAITGIESSFGQHMIMDSYNAYGWAGGYFFWDSWEKSIAHVNRVLSQKYYAKGLDTPKEIARVYAPPSKVWAKNVTYFMDKIEGFEETPISSEALDL